MEEAIATERHVPVANGGPAHLRPTSAAESSFRGSTGVYGPSA